MSKLVNYKSHSYSTNEEKYFFIFLLSKSPQVICSKIPPNTMTSWSEQG